MAVKKKIIRITTVPISLKYLLTGQMSFMKENGFDVLMISAAGKEIDEVVINEGCEHKIVPMTRKITPVKDLICLWQLIKIFRKEKPDIIHTHTPKAGLLGMLAAKICNVKVRIHTVAGLPLMVEKGFKLKLLKFIEKLTYRCATQIWPNSFSLFRYILNQKLTDVKKLKVISKGSSNGINLDRFLIENLNENILEKTKKSISYDKENIYLLCIGRLVKDKGIIELVSSFNILNKTKANLRLVLVGMFEMDLDPLPLLIIDEIKNNANITHIEWSEYVEYYIALSNIFVFPSHREGFPNVLLQSGTMKTPIVCSNIPGNVDIVENETTGLLFEVSDETSILNQVTFALNNPKRMNEMAHALQFKIKESFDRRIIWNEILNEYNNQIKKL
jgi:glycosyltransferase involved in cell wall biosynthesis